MIFHAMILTQKYRKKVPFFSKIAVVVLDIPQRPKKLTSGHEKR